MSPPLAVCSLFTLVVIVCDLAWGGQLLKESLLSAYPLSGIRYYGIGNEYLGAALGFALMSGYAAEKKREERGRGEEGRQGNKTKRGEQYAISVFGLGGAGVCDGVAGLGANAGSLIVTGAGFGVGAWMLSGQAVFACRSRCSACWQGSGCRSGSGRWTRILPGRRRPMRAAH